MNDSGAVQIADTAQNIEKQGFFDRPGRVAVVAQPVAETVAEHEIEQQEKILLDFAAAVTFDDEFRRHVDACFALDALDQGCFVVAVDAPFFNQKWNIDLLQRVIFRLTQMHRPPDFAEAAFADFEFHRHRLRFGQANLKRRVFR